MREMEGGGVRERLVSDTLRKMEGRGVREVSIRYIEINGKKRSQRG